MTNQAAKKCKRMLGRRRWTLDDFWRLPSPVSRQAFFASSLKPQASSPKRSERLTHSRLDHHLTQAGIGNKAVLMGFFVHGSNGRRIGLLIATEHGPGLQANYRHPEFTIVTLGDFGAGNVFIRSHGQTFLQI